MVAQSDADGTSPGKEVLSALLRKAAPCAILALVAFIRQLEPGRQFLAGTFQHQLYSSPYRSHKGGTECDSFGIFAGIQLEAGGTTGQHALEALEKCFARVGMEAGRDGRSF